jgi:transposase-like protein
MFYCKVNIPRMLYGFVQKEVLHKQLDELLRNPSDEGLKKFQGELSKLLSFRPPCPKCENGVVYRRGTNATRKIGRVQQFQCRKCNHIYTYTSIEKRKKWKEYPKCPNCKSHVTRWGFWKWDGNTVQRYRCKKCGFYFRTQRKRKISDEDIKRIVTYTAKGTSVRVEGLESPKRMTGSGFFKKTQRVARALAEVNIYELFKPGLSPVICQDVVWCGEHCYYVGKDPVTRCVPHILPCLNENYENAYQFEREKVLNIGFIQKILVTDGDVDFDRALRVLAIENGRYDRVRTIWLGRTPREGGLTTWREQRTYLITKIGTKLLIEKGVTSPRREFNVDDERHHTTTIETVLNIFSEHNPYVVCIMSPEKYIHFKPFIARFLNAVKDDDYIYHFIGTGFHGNPWAETICKIIKRRERWCYFGMKSIDSMRLREKLRMIYYNVFLPQEQLCGQPPFRFAKANYKTCDEAWEILLSAL